MHLLGNDGITLARAEVDTLYIFPASSRFHQFNVDLTSQARLYSLTKSVVIVATTSRTQTCLRQGCLSSLPTGVERDLF